MNKIVLSLPFFLLLSLSLDALDWEYSAGDKTESLAILEEVNGIINNQNLLEKYKSTDGACEVGYSLNNGYCEKIKDVNYQVIGNLMVLENADTKLVIDLKNKTNNSTLSSGIIDLANTQVLNLDPFYVGGLVCKSDKVYFNNYVSDTILESSANTLTKEKSNTLNNYFIVDTPITGPNGIDANRNIVLTNLGCVNYGAYNTTADKAAVHQKLEQEIKIKRQDNITADISNGINTMGLSHIPLKIDSVIENGTKAKTLFKDVGGSQIPNPIKYHPVKISMSKTFYYPEGSVSKNIFSTNFTNGITELTMFETDYLSYPGNSKQDYVTNYGNFVLYPNQSDCETTFQTSDTDTVKTSFLVAKKNKKTKYNVLINYGNFLTQYDSNVSLPLFDFNNLDLYVVKYYGLDYGLYQSFVDKIPYSFSLQRDPNNTLVSIGDLTNKEEILPKILPVISNVESSNVCETLGETSLESVFAEVSLVFKEKNTIKKTKYIGLASLSFLETLGTDVRSDEVLTQDINTDFNVVLNNYISQVNNYINYDFERNGSISTTKNLGSQITMNFYNYKDDIFQQFIAGADSKTFAYQRYVVYTPVRLTLKYHKCN